MEILSCWYLKGGEGEYSLKSTLEPGVMPRRSGTIGRPKQRELTESITCSYLSLFGNVVLTYTRLCRSPVVECGGFSKIFSAQWRFCVR